MMLKQTSLRMPMLLNDSALVFIPYQSGTMTQRRNLHRLGVSDRTTYSNTHDLKVRG